MSDKKANIADRELKENPFILPSGYLPDLRNSISDRISKQSNRLVKRHRLLTRMAFATVASFALVAIWIIPFYGSNSTTESAVAEIEIIKSGFLRSSFIDFYYDNDENGAADTLTDGEVSEEEIISYLSENIDVILLASLE